MKSWPAAAHEAFFAAFSPVFAALLGGLPPGAKVPPALHEFARLRPDLRHIIAGALQARLLPEPRHFELSPAEAAIPAWAEPAALRRSLKENLQDRFLAALRGDSLTWPSPASDALMLCTGAISLDNFNSLFRFRDIAAGLDVFVLATEHLSRVAGLFVPAHGDVVTFAGDQTRILRHHFSGLSQRLLNHLAIFADSLAAGMARPPTPQRFATFLRGANSAHLGHQLWNELAAIDALCSELPHARLPVWLVPGAAGSDIEFYGPIDTLFPEIAGRVRRGLPDHAALTRHAYENGFILFRAAREYISEGLRSRVATLAATRAAPPRAASFALLIGLRVENRTAVDLAGLCALFVEEALRLHPGCTVIFDGHNAGGAVRGEQKISSYREEVASQSPLDVERQLVAAMRQRFAGRPVQILDTLGEPLAVSLVWSQACEGFIALWGAGLAKYRWVANKPGLIVTSEWNLRNKADLNIYDNERYMATPSQVVYVPTEVIQDQPAAPMLVAFEAPSYFNFSYDDAAMRQHVSAFLAALAGSGDAPAEVAAPAARNAGPSA
jgi:hypothetical protein